MVAATWLRLATALVLSTVGAARAAAATKVACVGDSITVGARSSTPAKTYPAQLGVLLGADYQVMNFGVGGTTLLRSGDSPYVNTPQYGASGSFAPDIVLIMLGTNDAKAANWSKSAAFDGDYKALLAHYAGLGSHPKIFVMLPPPVFGDNPYGISPTNFTSGVVPAVKKVAADTATPLIDVYTALAGAGADFLDNVHPRDVGNAQIAETVFRVLSGAPSPDAGAPDVAATPDARDSAVTETAAPEAPAPVIDSAPSHDVRTDLTTPADDAAGGAAGGGGGGAGGSSGATGTGGNSSGATGSSSSGGCSTGGGGARSWSSAILLVGLWLLARRRA
ncbi:MAG TPA: GDSL-type esterase/lipase family protein [Polyangia bacterium]|nr:GDSL-type esterase/lipase family protein [Polyangia bacterium]